MSLFLSLGAAAALALSANATAEVPAVYRPVVKEVVVPIEADEAWSLWTTNEGFQSFFPGPPGFKTNITLAPGGGGTYEVFLIANAPKGAQGCDDCVVLGYQKGRMLSFTWTNRPDMAVRGHHTNVVLMFEPLSPRETRVTFMQVGWGVGRDWDAAQGYFDRAWGHVLDAYKKRVEAICDAKADMCRLTRP